MSPRRKMNFACVLLWLIVTLVASSSGRPSDGNGEPDGASVLSQPGQQANLDNVPSVVVPQVGVLEERPDVTSIGKDPLPVIIAGPNAPAPGQTNGAVGSAGKGILVPIVSVNEGSPAKATNSLINPLVALLPAPLPSISSSAKPPELPPSVLHTNDQPARPVHPEVYSLRRRSLTSGSSDNEPKETMDVAEDIVFRPLFRIRQPTGRSSYYRTKYRRYNVNGYYRLPYNYFQSNNYQYR